MTKAFLSQMTTFIPYFILLLLSCITSIPFEVEGLKLNIIAPNSPISPAYLGNLTTPNKIKRLVSQSQARAHQILSRRKKFTNKNILKQASEHRKQSKIPRSPVTGYGPYNEILYLAEIGIGTFKHEDPNFKSYLMVIDTGSSQMWLQCEECKEKGNHCFPEVDPPFPNSQSYTYRPLKKNDSMCYSNDHFNIYSEDGYCHYIAEYEDGVNSRGQLAYETFTFRSNTENSSVKKNIVFGCGFNQTYGNVKKVQLLKFAGVLGLSRDKPSLQKQLDPAGIGLNFSYCFLNFFKDGLGDHQLISYLRFGEDITHDTNFLHTPFHSVLGDDHSYYIKVLDIMVNRNRLRIPTPIFQTSDGVIIDSGCSLTLLVKPAFDLLETYLISNFSANENYRRMPKHPEMPPLCYYMKKYEGYMNLPTIVFMLENGNLEIGPEQGFFVGKYERTKGQDFFCLMMKPHDHLTLIGAYQQVNHRFIYDTKQSKLWFKNDDCAINP